MTESELKTIIIRTALNHGWRVYTTAQAKPRRPPRVKTSAGYPDTTLAREPREFMWIEAKDEKGEMTDEQRTWQALLGTYVIRPSDVVSGYLMELLK
jgi:hypothetical protein